MPGEEFDPDFSDMPGTPEIRAAAARRVAIRRALGGVTMLSTLSDEELEEMTDAARVMDFTPPENARDDRKMIHARETSWTGSTSSSPATWGCGGPATASVAGRGPRRRRDQHRAGGPVPVRPRVRL